MLDLRLKEQFIDGFYIHQYKEYFAVGKNGTSYHEIFEKKDYDNSSRLKADILMMLNITEPHNNKTIKQ